jgi:hypothetical protein
MLQNENLRLPIGAHIPTSFHKDLDNLARWVRGSRFTDVEADFILEAVLEYLDPDLPSIGDVYRRMVRRVALFSYEEDRRYDIPQFRMFSHYVESLPPALVAVCRNEAVDPDSAEDDIVLIRDNAATCIPGFNIDAAAARQQRQ